MGQFARLRQSIHSFVDSCIYIAIAHFVFQFIIFNNVRRDELEWHRNILCIGKGRLKVEVLDIYGAELGFFGREDTVDEKFDNRDGGCWCRFCARILN